MARNPLTQVFINKQQRINDPAGERPNPQEPIPEEYDPATVFAYRGTQNHGVEPIHETNPMPGYEGDPLVITDEPSAEPDPIPVRVVSDFTREKTIYRAAQFLVPHFPIQLAGYHPQRVEFRIAIFQDTGIFLNGDANFQHAQGFYMGAWANLTLPGDGEIWAVNDHSWEPEANFMVNVRVLSVLKVPN